MPETDQGGANAYLVLSLLGIFSLVLTIVVIAVPLARRWARRRGGLYEDGEGYIIPLRRRSASTDTDAEGQEPLLSPPVPQTPIPRVRSQSPSVDLTAEGSVTEIERVSPPHNCSSRLRPEIPVAAHVHQYGPTSTRGIELSHKPPPASLFRTGRTLNRGWTFKGLPNRPMETVVERRESGTNTTSSDPGSPEQASERRSMPLPAINTTILPATAPHTSPSLLAAASSPNLISAFQDGISLSTNPSYSSSSTSVTRQRPATTISDVSPAVFIANKFIPRQRSDPSLTSLTSSIPRSTFIHRVEKEGTISQGRLIRIHTMDSRHVTKYADAPDSASGSRRGSFDYVPLSYSLPPPSTPPTSPLPPVPSSTEGSIFQTFHHGHHNHTPSIVSLQSNPEFQAPSSTSHCPTSLVSSESQSSLRHLNESTQSLSHAPTVRGSSPPGAIDMFGMEVESPTLTELGVGGMMALHHVPRQPQDGRTQPANTSSSFSSASSSVSRMALRHPSGPRRPSARARRQDAETSKAAQARSSLILLPPLPFLPPLSLDDDLGIAMTPILESEKPSWTQ